MITFVLSNRCLQNLSQRRTQETSEQIYCPGKSFRGPQTTTHRDSGKHSFPVYSGRLLLISFPLVTSRWLEPLLSGHYVYSRSSNISICLVPGRCQTFPHVEGRMDNLPSAHHDYSHLRFFSTQPPCIYFWAAEKCAFLVGAIGVKPIQVWNPTQVCWASMMKWDLHTRERPLLPSTKKI